MTDKDTKTVRMSLQAYDELMEVRRMMTRAGGQGVLPPEFAEIARVELEGVDEAYSRQAMQSIAARVLLAIAVAHTRAALRVGPDGAGAVETVEAEIIERAPKGKRGKP